MINKYTTMTNNSLLTSLRIACVMAFFALCYNCNILAQTNMLPNGRVEIVEKKEETRICPAVEIHEPITKPLLVAERMPEFPGGRKALQDFLDKHLIYPKQVCLRDGVKDCIAARVVVNPDGTLSDINILRSLGRYCDQEALRVIKLMPNWIPAKQNGRAVPCYFTIPIAFKPALQQIQK
jgi:protein TonB